MSLSPKDLVDEAITRGKAKANYSLLTIAVLGTMAGIFIGLAGVAMIRTMGSMPKEWGTLVNLLGAVVFPFGLICLLLVGGGVILAGMYFLAFKVGMKQNTEGLESTKTSSIIVEEK